MCLVQAAAASLSSLSTFPYGTPDLEKPHSPPWAIWGRVENAHTLFQHDGNLGGSAVPGGVGGLVTSARVVGPRTELDRSPNLHDQRGAYCTERSSSSAPMWGRGVSREDQVYAATNRTSLTWQARNECDREMYEKSYKEEIGLGGPRDDVVSALLGRRMECHCYATTPVRFLRTSNESANH